MTKLDKEKFDEIFDSGCWPATLSEDPKDPSILQLVLWITKTYVNM